MDFLYLLCTPRACVVLEVLLYCPDLRFNDDGIKPLVMEDVVQAPVTMSIVTHEPFLVVSELPLVVTKSIFDLVEEIVGEHDDIAQSLGSMGIRKEIEESIDDRIQLILSTHLIYHSIFFANALYVCMNEPSHRIGSNVIHFPGIF